MKIRWDTMESAPKDREILLFGADEYGNEMTAFASWEISIQYDWEWVTSTEDEQHKRRVKKEVGYWDSGIHDIFPVLWADVERPMSRQKPLANKPDNG